MARSRNRKWLIGEVGLAVVSGLLAMLTLVWPDWIEEVFGIDIDQHSGALEWLIVLSLVFASVASGALARVEWKRLQSA